MISIPKQHKTTLLSYLGMGIVLALIGGLLHFVASPQVLIEYMKYAVVVVFFINIYYSLFVQKLPIYHPYVMFLGMFFLFIINRIFLDVIGFVDFAQTNMFSHYVFDQEVQSVMLLNIGLALIGLQLGSIVAFFIHPYKNEVEPETDEVWAKLGIALFYIGVPFLVYQYLMSGFEVMEKGYGVKLAGTLEYRNSILTTIMSRLSYCGILFYFASFPRSKWVYMHLGVFVIVYSLQLLQGMRGPVMCMFLVVFFYVLSQRLLKAKVHTIMIFIIGLFVLSSFIGSFRSNSTLKEKENWAYEFLYDQGVSLQVLGYAIEHDNIDYRLKDMFAHARYRMAITRGRFLQSDIPVGKENIMREFGNLSYQLTDRVNPKALRGGWDMGGSYLAELYLLGNGILQFFINILIGFVTIFLTNKLRSSKYGMLFLLLFLTSWLYIPRDNLFDFITDNMTNVVFLICIMVLNASVRKYLKNTRI